MSMYIHTCITHIHMAVCQIDYSRLSAASGCPGVCAGVCAVYIYTIS